MQVSSLIYEKSASFFFFVLLFSFLALLLQTTDVQLERNSESNNYTTEVVIIVIFHICGSFSSLAENDMRTLIQNQNQQVPNSRPDTSVTHTGMQQALQVH